MHGGWASNRPCKKFNIGGFKFGSLVRDRHMYIMCKINMKFWRILISAVAKTDGQNLSTRQNFRLHGIHSHTEYNLYAYTTVCFAQTVCSDNYTMLVHRQGNREGVSNLHPPPPPL